MLGYLDKDKVFRLVLHLRNHFLQCHKTHLRSGLAHPHLLSEVLGEEL